jgi:hypothetical protein
MLRKALIRAAKPSHTAGTIYEKMSGGRGLYREKRILLPFPEFIVLYNGKGPYPDEKELKLPESFCDPGELGPRGVKPGVEGCLCRRQETKASPLAELDDSGGGRCSPCRYPPDTRVWRPYAEKGGTTDRRAG